jgi:hypothetical protein
MLELCILFVQCCTCMFVCYYVRTICSVLCDIKARVFMFFVRPMSMCLFFTMLGHCLVG